MPYPAGHRPAVKRKIIDSARKLFNRHGFESVSLHQIMSGAGLTPGGFYSYFKSKSDLYAEVLACFFTDRTGKTAGKVCIWTCHPPTWELKSSAPIYLDSISTTLRTPARWWHCRPTLRVAARPHGAPSRRCSKRWLAF